MTSIDSVTLDVPDPTAAETFHTALGVGTHVGVRASDVPTTGFRGFTLSLVVSQPSNVDAIVGAASKRFYVDRGMQVAKSFGSKYVEFSSQSSHLKLALYGRHALAKDAGVSPDGTGSHRIVIGSADGPFTDPDGFSWEAA